MKITNLEPFCTRQYDMKVPFFSETLSASANKFILDGDCRLA